MCLMVSSEEPSKLLRMPSALLLRAHLEHVVAEAVAGAQQQHGLLLQLFRGDGLAPGQRMGLGQGHDERLVVERRHGQPGVGEGLGHDGAVELAGAQHVQQLDGEVLLQDERHLRRHLDGVLHQLGQQVGPDRVDDAQPQRARQRVLAELGDLLDGGGLLDDLLRLAHDLVAQRRHAHLVGATLEELDVEFFLELLHRHAERGLGDETGVGGPAEVLLTCHGHDVLELGEGHGVIVPPWIMPSGTPPCRRASGRCGPAPRAGRAPRPAVPARAPAAAARCPPAGRRSAAARRRSGATP